MKYLKKKVISRRTILKGAGASISLPLLEAMIPHQAKAQTAQKPIIINSFFSNGYPSFRSDSDKIGTGQSGQGKYGCEPRYLIDDYLNRLNTTARSMSCIIPNTVSSHLYFRSGWRQHGNSVGLYSGRINESRYKGVGDFNSNGRVSSDLMLESYDQRIARELGLKGINVVARQSNWGGQLNAETLNLISWKRMSANSEKAIPEISFSDPMELYNHIIGQESGAQSNQARISMLKSRRSILDMVLPDIGNLKNQLPMGDQRLIDQYLSGIREIEKKISTELGQLESGNTSGKCEGFNIGNRYLGAVNNYDQLMDRIRLLQDIMTKAMECDLYQVFGFTHNGIADFLNAFGSNTHTLSHWFFADGGDTQFSGNVKAQQEAKRGNYYRSAAGQMHVFADWMNRLADIKQANCKPLLERVIANISTDHAEEHAEVGMPVFLCGRGGGGIPAHNGRVFSAPTPDCRYIQHHISNNNMAIETADVWLSIMRGVGLNINSFGARNKGVIPGFLG